MNTSLFSINILPAKVEGQPIGTKIVNTIGASIEEALTKVRTAYPGAEIRGVNKLQSIDIP